MATSRIKLLRNKRQAVVTQMRRDVAMLLESGQEATARIRVEHVIREQNIMAANEIIELFCELVVVRLPIIAKQKACPADLKEGISSLIFAAPRCSDIPELAQIRDIFEKKYGKEFVTAAMELRPECGVNRTLIERLSVRTPTAEAKLKVMREIAKEHGVEWDTTEYEKELLKPTGEVLEGPRTFISATGMPMTKTSSKDSRQWEPRKETQDMQFKDASSAAEAAADSAQKAIMAAQAAAFLAQQNSLITPSAKNNISGLSHTVSSTQISTTDACQPDVQILDSLANSKSQCMNNGNKLHTTNSGDEHIFKYQKNSEPRSHSDIKFDDSDGLDTDCDEEMEMETRNNDVRLPPQRPPPSLPEDELQDKHGSSSSKQNLSSRVHPKLPDYDALAARFEALKYRKT